MANNNININVTTNADSAGKKFEGLSSSISRSATQADKLDRAFKFLDSAFNTGKIDIQNYAKLTEKLDREQTELYAALSRTTSNLKAQGTAVTANATRLTGAAEAAERLANRQRMAGKSTNRFGMYAQQVGYQVGDFAVQVQSGTNALVAFGQQGTQLAGLLPGIYGAILGIGLSVTTATLQASGSLKGLTFDFKKFKEDALKFINPIMPAIRLLGDAFVFMGGKIVDSINLSINAFQYMVALWRAIPSAIGAGVDWIVGHFRRLELLALSTSTKVQAAWRGMVDAISGTETMVKVMDVDADGEVIEKFVSAVENLNWQANNLQTQSELLGVSLERTGGFGKVLVESLEEVEKIDLRNLMDYFGFSDKAEEESAKAKGAVEDAVEEIDKSLQSLMKSSMEDGLMSMIEGTKSVEDAFRDMARDIIKELYRVLVVQKMVSNVSGLLEGGGSSGGIFGAIGGAIGKVFSSFDGGGYTGSGPRSGGLDGRGGYLAMVHPRETVVDHTKAGNPSVDGGVTVVQNFNFQANGDESVKKIIAQAAPSIINASKTAVINERRRGGTPMKAAFG